MRRSVFALVLAGVLSVVSFAQTNYLSTLSVRDLCHYGNTLYQATGGGLVVTNDDMGNAVRYDHSNGLPTSNLTSVETDSTGIVWVSSGNRVMGLRLSATQATVVVDTAFGTMYSGVLSMVARKGVLWVLVDGKMISYSQSRWTIYDDGSTRYGVKIQADENGNLWTFASGGLSLCFNVMSKTWTESPFPVYFQNANLYSACVVNSKFLLFSFWGGTLDNKANTDGIFLASLENGSWIWEEVDTVPRKLLNDSYGNAFVYQNDELFVCQLNKAYDLSLIPTGIIQTLPSSIETYGPEKKLWIGDDISGLSFFKNMAVMGKYQAVASTAQFPYGINIIKSVMVDEQGNAWIMGIMEQFIAIFNPKSGTWKNQDNHLDGVTSATVKAIGRGSNKDMWFVTPKEVVKQKADGSRSTYLGCGGEYVYDKMKDWIWIVGDSNKVQSYSYQSPTAFQPVIRCEVHLNLTLTKIAPISPTEFYVASSGSNQAIYHYKDGVWIMTIIATTGTCDMDVRNGELFVGTDYGIHSSVDGQTWNFTPKNAKGLNYSSLYCLEIAPSGEIYLGTNNGIFIGSSIDVWSKTINVSSPIVTPSVTSITFDEVNKLVWYAGTEGITTFPWEGGSTINLNQQSKVLNLAAPSISLNRQGIRYSLPGTEDVRLSVFSVSGRALASQTISGNVRSGLLGLSEAATGNLVYQIQSGKTRITGTLTNVK